MSNDNPYSEANFKTPKYFPEFPGRFRSIQDARAFYDAFFHVLQPRAPAPGPGPAHAGLDPLRHRAEIRASRALVLDAAYAANPQRFTKPPVPPRLPTAAWINQPTPEALIQTR